MSETQTSEVQRLRAALEKISKLGTSQNASPQQCEAVLIAMDALRGMPKDASRADTERLDWLEKNRCYTNREGEKEINCNYTGTLRQAIDAARALTAREEGE